MKRFFMLAMMLMMSVLSTPVLAEHGEAGHGAHAVVSVAVPHNTEWVYWVALGFLWLFIAAILLGPIALWIKGPERPEVVSHAAAGHGAHH